MIINLISGPRNVSTALMYAFAQRPDTSVVDEPFYGYYLAKTGIFHPGKKRIMDSMSTDIDTITSELLRQDKEESVLFIKNMAHHHIGVSRKFLTSVKNVFLIRHPAELIVSFSKVIKDPSLQDIGVKKSWELYHYLVDLGQNVVVIDSSQLLKNPVKYIKELCRVLDIKYSSKMQKWPLGGIKEDGIWAEYWYQNLHRTTGFVKSQPKKTVVPENLMPLCYEALPFYNELYNISFKL